MPDSSKPKYPHAGTKLDGVIAAKQGILHPGDNALEAEEKMRSLGVDALPVTENDRLVGVVDREFSALEAAGRGHDPKTLTIGEVMNRKLVYCAEEDDAATALRRMEEHRLDHICVVDPSLRVVGMVHWSDLARSEAERVLHRNR
jgi:CBS domain-containing protein